MLRIFYGSLIAAAAGLTAAYYYGGWAGIAITAILSVLEVTLSIENAIVNAIVLKDMDKIWRARFLTWGILIAVFGMRLVFPLGLVSCITHIDPITVFTLALEQPLEYAHYLAQAHDSIAAFGGMFLLMVFLEFILDQRRRIHWLGVIEKTIGQAGNVEAIEVVVALLILLLIQDFADQGMSATILVAGIIGISTYVIIHGFAKIMQHQYSGKIIKHAGIMSFVYLEFLDASFSLDGVIGAFAITQDIVFITLGLGIGAFFVRSMTILLVHKKTLQKYIYLEHGAYYALGSLSIMMLLSIYYHIPEILIGSVGAVVIGLSFLSSVRRSK